MAAGMAGFFDIDERLKDLPAKGDDLERIKALVACALRAEEYRLLLPITDPSSSAARQVGHLQ